MSISRGWVVGAVVFSAFGKSSPLLPPIVGLARSDSRVADRLLASLASMNLRACLNDIAWLASPSRSI